MEHVHWRAIIPQKAAERLHAVVDGLRSVTDAATVDPDDVACVIDVPRRVASVRSMAVDRTQAVEDHGAPVGAGEPSVIDQAPALTDRLQATADLSAAAT